MDLTSALQDLGLTDKQSRIYLALLQYGEGTAYEAAKQSGIKKPTAYVLLEEMVERRIVKKVLHPKATRYAAIDPVEIFVIARSKFERAEAALPELRAMSKSKNQRVRAEYFEGLSGVREMYQNITADDSKEQIAFYAHGRDTSPELMKYWLELNKEYAQQGIKRRGITTNDPSLKDYLNYKVTPKEFIEFKALSPKIYDSNISIEVFGAYTRILSHKYLQGIIIDNPDVASVMKQIFEIVWKYAPAYK
jgi:HTH-type transcriptional regulator, sugar sensing transcriptional regulator